MCVGECSLIDGVCEAANDADCAQATTCTDDGQCTAQNGIMRRMMPTVNHLLCAQFGLCSADAGTVSHLQTRIVLIERVQSSNLHSAEWYLRRVAPARLSGDATAVTVRGVTYLATAHRAEPIDPPGPV